jgi:hypothetical protein
MTLVNRASNVYITGTRISVKKVEKNIPPTTAKPKGRRDSAPAPRPIAIGRTPKIVEKEVIRMGRRRIVAARTTALTFASEIDLSYIDDCPTATALPYKSVFAN